MTCCRLLVGVVAVVAPLSAHADGPCEAEAAAARRGKIDASLAPPTQPDAIAHMKAGNARSLEGTKLASIVATRDQAPAAFKAAVDEYVAAALISPSPSILYNLAQTYRAAGDYANAIEQYRLYLARGKPGRPLRNLVECHIAAMTAELDRAASTAPPQGPGDGTPADAPAEPAAEPAPPAVATEPSTAATLAWQSGGAFVARPWYDDWVGWTAVGAGVAAGGAGAYLLLDARSLRDDAAHEPRDLARKDLDARADSRQTWGTVATAAGVAVLAAGVIKLAITPEARRETNPRAQVSLQVTPGGVALGGWF